MRGNKNSQGKQWGNFNTFFRQSGWEWEYLQKKETVLKEDGHTELDKEVRNHTKPHHILGDKGVAYSRIYFMTYHTLPHQNF